jgi:hypothetical protein
MDNNNKVSLKSYLVCVRFVGAEISQHAWQNLARMAQILTYYIGDVILAAIISMCQISSGGSSLFALVQIASINSACLGVLTLISHSNGCGMHIHPGTILSFESTSLPSTLFFFILKPHNIRLMFRYSDFSARWMPGHILRPAP